MRRLKLNLKYINMDKVLLEISFTLHSQHSLFKESTDIQNNIKVNDIKRKILGFLCIDFC